MDPKTYSLNLTFTQSSADISKTKLVHDWDGSILLDMNDDPRVDKLVAQVKKEIETAKSKGHPYNEKEISTRIVQLIHKPQYFGPYDKKMDQVIGKEERLQSEIDIYTPKNGQPIAPAVARKKEKLENQLKELAEQHAKFYAARGEDKLSGYKSGHLVCREEASIASYVMDQVGIENDLCMDIHSTAHANNHAFIQPVISKMIVEATDPLCPYFENISGGMIRDGKTVIVRNPNERSTAVYGDGSIQVTEGVSKEDAYRQFSENPNADQIIADNHAAAFADYEKAYLQSEDGKFKKPVAFDKPIKLTDAQRNVENAYIKMDAGDKGALGPVQPIGILDGKLEVGEYIAALAKNGVRISNKELEALRKDKNPNIATQDYINSNLELLRLLDANKDGKITPKEYKDGMTEYTKIMEAFYKETRSQSPISLENASKMRQEMIYGLNK